MPTVQPPTNAYCTLELVHSTPGIVQLNTGICDTAQRRGVGKTLSSSSQYKVPYKRPTGDTGRAEVNV